MHLHHDWTKDIARHNLDQSRIGKQLAQLFADKLQRPASTSRTTASPLSHKTQAAKARALVSVVVALRTFNPPIRSLWVLEHHHIEWLCRNWREAGNTRGAIENKLSHLRTLAKWIGKPQLVLPTDEIEVLQGTAKRSGIATRDKSWTGNGVDIAHVIEQASYADPYVAIQLLMQRAFGLRAEESFLMRPAEVLTRAEREGYLDVTRGTKGGRTRTVPLLSKEQIAVLIRAKRFANDKSGSTIPAQYSLEQWRGHYYYICKRVGITQAGLGVTSHGLRHENLQGLFQQMSGEDAPIKASVDGVQPNRDQNTPRSDLEKLALKIVVEAAGHSRIEKSGAYLGRVGKVVPASRMLEVTDSAIQKAIADAGGNRSAAAKQIGISRAYLYKRLGLLR